MPIVGELPEWLSVVAALESVAAGSAPSKAVRIAALSSRCLPNANNK
jgi:hypothetical protein